MDKNSWIFNFKSILFAFSFNFYHWQFNRGRKCALFELRNGTTGHNDEKKGLPI